MGTGGNGGSSGGASCSDLLAKVTETQAAAQTCNPKSANSVLQCQGSLPGLCCPIGVESASMTDPNNAAYLAALKEYNANKCAHPCPAIACIAPKAGDCQQSAAGAKCSP